MVKIIQILSFAGQYDNELYGLDESGGLWKMDWRLHEWVFVIESPEER